MTLAIQLGIQMALGLGVLSCGIYSEGSKSRAKFHDVDATHAANTKLQEKVAIAVHACGFIAMIASTCFLCSTAVASLQLPLLWVSMVGYAASGIHMLSVRIERSSQRVIHQSYQPPFMKPVVYSDFGLPSLGHLKGIV